jgi:hypothetical protein
MSNSAPKRADLEIDRLDRMSSVDDGWFVECECTRRSILGLLAAALIGWLIIGAMVFAALVAL